MEAEAARLEEEAERTLRRLRASPSASSADVAKAVDASTDATVEAWQQLYGELLVRSSDGWNYDPVKKAAARVGYPVWWLKEVGYQNGTTPCKAPCP